MRLLIVDDSETSRLLLSAILKGEGFSDLVFAPSALDALNLLDSQAHTIDLVLMDLNMPDMDGIEALRRIKAGGPMRDIPILMVTADDSDANLERAFEAGATDYITKPVSKVELRARVRAGLRLKRETDNRKERERELEALTRELKEISNQDGLTGVANRRCFEASYAREWLRCRREGVPLSLLMIDIDFFKNYNDAYGHLQGDSCLKTVARVLRHQGNRRAGDLSARYGGEEFVVLLPNTDLDGALKVAHNIRRELDSAAMPHANSTAADHVTVSIGAACVIPTADIGPEDLLGDADRALYQAKRDGRDRVTPAPARAGAGS
ncbi:MAG: diguanylate cyclase [Desulfovibrionaceae bacterium]